MRPVLHADVVAAGCALLRVAPAARSGLLARMLNEADVADRYRRDTGQLHPLWGNGSLMAAAMIRPHAREPFLDDPDYAACLALVFDALVARTKPGASTKNRA